MARFLPGQSGNPAGRTRKAERYAAPITAAEDQIADQLPKLLANMLRLANGDYWEEEEERVPSGLVTTGSGEFESPVFPDKDPAELVVVRRKRRKAAPDRKANEYLIDRILGRPTQAVEAALAETGALTITVVYDDAHPDHPAAGPASGPGAD